MHDYEDRLATPAEADREYATNVGSGHRDVPWILSDRDVWYRNPYYKGKPVPHPDDECYDETDNQPTETDMTNNVEVWFGDIEFGDFVKDAATSCKVAIVHRIVETRMYPPETADALAEQAIAAASRSEACDYLIPSQFDGEILYASKGD